MFPTVEVDQVPWVTVEQMRTVDDLMVSSGVSLLQMMENAGRSLAAVARHLLDEHPRDSHVCILAGQGSNGGGGLAAGRHLVAAGAHVSVQLSGRPPPDSAAAHQLAVLERWEVPIRLAGLPSGHEPDLVVDALLGYGQRGPPHGTVADLIEWTAGRRTLALDTPSGLELAAGKLHRPAVRAAATVTLAAGKDALRAYPDAVGRLYLADISVPAHILEAVGVAAGSPFSAAPLVAVRLSTTDG